MLNCTVAKGCGRRWDGVGNPGGRGFAPPPGIERSLNQAVPTERLVFSGLVISKQWAIVIQMLLLQSFNSMLSKREEV